MDFKVGDKVIFVSGEEHDYSPTMSPPVGTIGTVKHTTSRSVCVQWPVGSVSFPYEWWHSPDSIRLLEKSKYR